MDSKHFNLDIIIISMIVIIIVLIETVVKFELRTFYNYVFTIYHLS